MREREVLDKFERLEKELGLPDDRINGVPWWDKLRYWLYREIYKSVVLSESGNEIKNSIGCRNPQNGVLFREWLRKLTVFCLSLINIFGKQSPVWVKPHGILIYGHSRRKYENGVYVDIYTDPLVALMPSGRNVSVIETWSQGKHSKPAGTKNLFYWDSLDSLTRIAKFIAAYRCQIKRKDRGRIRYYEKKINHTFGTKINIFENVNSIVRAWPIDFFIYDVFLRIKKPSHVFLVVSTHHETLVAACKKNGVPVLELQHGSPARGKMNYDYTSGGKKETFPDWFVSFGAFWTEGIQLPVDDSHVFHLGFPYLDQKLKKYRSLKKSISFLFISQPSVAKELVAFALAIADYFGRESEIHYKPHPAECSYDVLRYSPLLESVGVTVVTPEKDLHRLLALSQHHVGVYSTALYEGIAFGGRCLVLDVPGSEYMDLMVERGYAQLVSKPEDIDLCKEKGAFNKDLLFAPSNQSKLKILLEVSRNWSVLEDEQPADLTK